jgi:hypothetical protein
MPDTATVLTPTEARQASPRRMNFRVLTWSMALAVAAAAVLYYAVYANPESPIGVPKQQPATSAPAPDTMTPLTPEVTPPATPPRINP